MKITLSGACRFQSWLLVVALLLPALGLGRLAHGQAAKAEDPIVKSAVFLLQSGLIPDRRGQFSTMLRSLRQMQDPELAPLFHDLVLSENRVMRIHGILGLAEIATPKQVDLKLLADVKDPAMQSELIGAALDSELLSKANAKIVLGWPGTEMDAKVVIATHLLQDKMFDDVALLKKALETENPARKGIVAMLLTQMGDAMGPALLAELNQSKDASRDPVRNLVLQTAYRFEFDRIVPWAMTVATEPGANDQLSQLAMRTAMRFGNKEAMSVWSGKFSMATEVADQMRLALSLLNQSQYLDAGAFAVLVNHADPLMKQMGLTGRAVAMKKDVGVEVSKLIAMDYPVAIAWALGYATHHATPEDMRIIYTKMIENYTGSDDRNKQRRLDEAMVAAQYFVEKDSAAAQAVIQPLLNKENAEKQFVQGMLVALIRAIKGEPHKIAGTMSMNLTDINTNGLRSLVLAKHGVKLTAPQLNDLGLVVRGGGALPDALRLQAAWVYVKQTGQAKAAIEMALKR